MNSFRKVVPNKYYYPVAAAVDSSTSSSSDAASETVSEDIPIVIHEIDGNSVTCILSKWERRKIDAESVINDRNLLEHPIRLVYVYGKYEMQCNPDYSHVFTRVRKTFQKTTIDDIKEPEDAKYIIAEGFKIKRRHYDKYVLGFTDKRVG
uniref:Uncharacterized protein n=1 Tax=Panagrolaimus sp. JU765 TaxID=591449 RepID=A0AC34Q765_9BILA